MFFESNICAAMSGTVFLKNARSSVRMARFTGGRKALISSSLRIRGSFQGFLAGSDIFVVGDGGAEVFGGGVGIEKSRALGLWLVVRVWRSK